MQTNPTTARADSSQKNMS